MILTVDNAVEYLRSRGHLGPGEAANARQLSGGVSAVVIHVARSDRDELVLKQAQNQLNVADPWYCSAERIWREVEVLEVCSTLIQQKRAPAGFAIEVPRLKFTDRENHLYAMSAAPTRHVVWKRELLSGIARSKVAQCCGALLGMLHARSWHDASLARQFDDRQFFYDLRLEPYYRQVARVHRDVSAEIEHLIESVCRERHSLVHGDFSPKNLLVCDRGPTGECLWLIDFEVGHYGDPAFDLGFFLSHIMLKASYHAPRHGAFLDLAESFWSGYHGELQGIVSPAEVQALVRRSIRNLAGCILARLDGKSPIDYLNDPERRDRLRELCKITFSSELSEWPDVRRVAEGLLSGR